MRHACFAGTLLAVVTLLALSGGGRDRARAESLTAGALLHRAFDDGEVVAASATAAWSTVRGVVLAAGWEGFFGLTEASRPPVWLVVEGDTAMAGALQAAARQGGVLPVAPERVALGRLRLRTQPAAQGHLVLQVMWEGRGAGAAVGSARAQEVVASRIAGPWWSILPPLLAILLAVFYGKALLALVSAVLLGAALTYGFEPTTVLYHALVTYVLGALTDEFKLYVLGFTMALVGMVQVTARSGGNQGLIDLVGRIAKTARSTRVAVACMGLCVFFDDYANTLVVGTSARPMTDKMRISREKLAYIVDSTAAPIAGLAIISTWVGYEVGLFDALSTDLNLGLSGFEILLTVLPMRFYCLLTIVFVLCCAISGRDFGPMLAAERQALAHGVRGATSPQAQKAMARVAQKEGVPARWYNAAIPVAVTLAGVVVGIAWDGTQVMLAEGGVGPNLATFDGWRQAFSVADNGWVLFWAAVAGSVAAIALAMTQGLLTLGESVAAWSNGVRMMVIAVAILILAWCMQAVTEDLGTSFYLVSVLEPLIVPAVLPVAVFLAAAAVAFATGTSWGTMGILMPALIPLAWMISGDMGLTLLCMGAILDGAIFGDHCSPISDTTVMSSLATHCDHLAHVRTQAPYAVVVMAIAVGVGYALLPQGLPLWGVFVLGIGLILAVFVVIGRPIAPPLTQAR